MASKSSKNQGIRIELAGLKDVLRDLKRLQNPERLKWMKKAIRAAGAHLLKEIRKAIRRYNRSGTMRKSMKSKLKYYKKTDTLVMMLGVQSWFAGTWHGKRVIPHNYLHFLVKGRKAFTQTHTIPVFAGKGGAKRVAMARSIGAVPANNFFESVVKTHGAAAIQAASRVVAKGLAG